METRNLTSRLIAYIPVLNRRHIDWLKKYPAGRLFLITQAMAESLIPRLSRNIGAVPTETMIRIIQSEHLVYSVSDFAPDWDDPDPTSPKFQGWILPDEDVSHALAKEYLAGTKCQFDDIHARYDMTAVKRQSPVMEGVEFTSNPGNNLRMDMAKKVAPQSPDWWRQIGATLFVNGACVATACNNHYPTEYVTDIMGDPRMNVDAGQVGKYVSFHAEKAVIIECARKGISTKGSSLYTTVFPCEDCARAIALAGIDSVFFEEGYSALDAQEVLQSAGVKIIQVKKEEPGPA